MNIQEGIKIPCEDCGNDWRWIPTSTIKPVRCPRCQNLLDFQKSKDRIEKNKILLSQATGYGKNNGSKSNLYKNSRLDRVRQNEPKIASKRKRVHWSEKPLPQLLRYVQYQFCNPYIRERDKNCHNHKCISCNGRGTQAGHRYSVGSFSGMRFMVSNIHGQDDSCNRWKSGNVDAYDRGLAARFGDQYVADLKFESAKYIQNGTFKWNFFDVVQIGYTYDYLLKNKIWIFTQKEFNEYRDLVNKNK